MSFMENHIYFISKGGSNPVRVSRVAERQRCGKLLENINGYSLRSFSCLGNRPLRENYEAPLGGQLARFCLVLLALCQPGKDGKPKSAVIASFQEGSHWRLPAILTQLTVDYVPVAKL